MPKKSIIFIEPAGCNTNVFETFMRQPLMGSLYLGTILHNAGYSVKIFNENILAFPIDLYENKADIYCISALTVSANRAILLAQEIRRIYPQSKIIIGGIHASLCPETFECIADHIVYGEAESIIVDLIEGNFTEKNVQGSHFENIDNLPFVNYDLLEQLSTMDIIPMMTSRGCPFDCNFCTVTKMFGKKFRMQSPKRIIQEIKHALTFFRTRTIFFYDDNFTANRNRVKELCQLIMQEKLTFTWVTQVRSDIAREHELLGLMEEAGCRFVFIGFESINDATLKAMHKSQTRKDIELAIQTIRNHGISIHGMFIFGDDNDTPETIKATVNFAIQQHIDTIQFMILTPFPGTKYYEDIILKDRLIHRRWEYFNGMFAVFRPANMSPTRLQQETIKAYKRFYSLRRLSVDALRLLIDITVDAFIWNFSRVFAYNFDTVFIKAGARFIVGRYAKTFEPYLEFLYKIEEKAILNNETLNKKIISNFTKTEKS